MVELKDISSYGDTLALVVTAVWAVSKIRSTSEKLGIIIQHLERAVQRLDQTQEALRGDLVSVRERLIRLETVAEGDVSHQKVAVK